MLYLPPTTFFFFNDTATTEIYTLSLHDALPISSTPHRCGSRTVGRLSKAISGRGPSRNRISGDRKSTRLNSSHVRIAYAVFCLEKKKCSAVNLLHRICYGLWFGSYAATVVSVSL